MCSNLELRKKLTTDSGKLSHENYLAREELKVSLSGKKQREGKQDPRAEIRS